jgi:hypothetical protein
MAHALSLSITPEFHHPENRLTTKEDRQRALREQLGPWPQ